MSTLECMKWTLYEAISYTEDAKSSAKELGLEEAISEKLSEANTALSAVEDAIIRLQKEQDQ